MGRALVEIKKTKQTPGNSNPENSLAASEYQNYLPSIEIAGMAKTKQLPHIEKCDEFIENVEIFL